MNYLVGDSKELASEISLRPLTPRRAPIGNLII